MSFLIPYLMFTRAGYGFSEMKYRALSHWDSPSMFTQRYSGGDTLLS